MKTLPCFCVSAFLALLLAAPASAQATGKPRVFVLTDIANEPDDEQSMVRFLVYANEFEVEGLVATTSTWLRSGPREDLIRRQLEAFGKVRSNLVRHAAGYPTREELDGVVATGQPDYGMAGVGDGKSSPGSRLLLAAADRPDPRPLWVSVWGGVNTLAQTLWDARRERSPEQLAELVSRLRVYTISDQDDAGPWLRTQFPDLFYIVSPSPPSWEHYYRATWTGISGDRHYQNGPMVDIELVENPWLEENVIRGHGPLGELYPRLEYIMEGDTPSYLGLIPNGLGWLESPAFGGWGGRYALYQPLGETRPIWTENALSRDKVLVQGEPHTSNQATIWRWRRHYQHDFAARMDWCVAEDPAQANHNPVAVLNGDRSHDLVRLTARPGETVRLSADGSGDPDGHGIAVSWMVYPEAGTLAGEVHLSRTSGLETSLTVPTPGRGSPPAPTIHVILTVEDDGSPSLAAYRRAIITVE